MEEIELWNCTELTKNWPRCLWAKDVVFVAGGDGEEAVHTLEKFGMKTFEVYKAFQSKKYPKYILIIGSYRKHEDPKFNMAMWDLQKYMNLYGYSDYEEVSKELLATIFENGLDSQK